jgi:DNA-binding CsgD family transcriptional regulator/pimeloyl-ACP methyl ester carboxylesterase
MLSIVPLWHNRSGILTLQQWQTRRAAVPGAEDRVRSVLTVPPISYARGADGVSLAFTVAGDGPALVFVPWVPFSNLRMEWQNPRLNAVFELLVKRLTLVHYDGRGTGHSQRDVTDLSLDAMVSDLEAVINRAGLAEVTLLGQYNSCPHAIAYAARHPDRVTRMVLFCGSARGWNAMSAKQTQAMLSLIEQDWDLFADTAAHQWMGWSAGDAGRAVAETIRSAVTPQIARATMQAASAVDVTELLPGVAAPTLVLHPRDMTQIPVEVARSLAMGLPRGRLILLEGTQPVLFPEQPDEVATMLADFLVRGIEPAETPSDGPSAGRRVAPASDGLSAREHEVLQLVAAGESNSQIARRLGLSTHTIERHVANVYRKIGARGRADATAYAMRNGLA